MSEHDQPELDGLRIRQLATLRRAAYRSRSHAIVATLVCAAAVVQAGILLFRHIATIGWGWRLLVYAAFVILGAWGARFFFSRAIALHREATQTRLDSPATPPDFTALGDGSQRWKNLEEIQ
jgi:fatty acid desaturase